MVFRNFHNSAFLNLLIELSFVQHHFQKVQITAYQHFRTYSIKHSGMQGNIHHMEPGNKDIDLISAAEIHTELHVFNPFKRRFSPGHISALQ
ncbi:hypothetical protein D3C85_1736600 [compost metagenome]